MTLGRKFISIIIYCLWLLYFMDRLSYRWGNWSFERESNFFKLIQFEISGALYRRHQLELTTIFSSLYVSTKIMSLCHVKHTALCSAHGRRSVNVSYETAFKECYQPHFLWSLNELESVKFWAYYLERNECWCSSINPHLYQATFLNL